MVGRDPPGAPAVRMDRVREMPACASGVSCGSGSQYKLWTGLAAASARRRRALRSRPTLRGTRVQERRGTLATGPKEGKEAKETRRGLPQAVP